MIEDLPPVIPDYTSFEEFLPDFKRIYRGLYGRSFGENDLNESIILSKTPSLVYPFRRAEAFLAWLVPTEKSGPAIVFSAVAFYNFHIAEVIKSVPSSSGQLSLTTDSLGVYAQYSGVSPERFTLIKI